MTDPRLPHLRAARRRCALRRWLSDRRSGLSCSRFPADAIQLLLHIQLEVKLLRSWSTKHGIMGGNVEERHDRRLHDIELHRLVYYTLAALEGLFRDVGRLRGPLYRDRVLVGLFVTGSSQRC
jgi:hypothetical protein